MNHHEMEVRVARILKQNDVRWYNDPATKTRHIHTSDIRKSLSEEDKEYIRKYFELIEYPYKIIFD